MAINKNLIVLGIGAVAVVGMLVVKHKKSACNKEEKCAETPISNEVDETNVVAITEEEYSLILSEDVISAFHSIAEAAEMSIEDGVDKAAKVHSAIDKFVTSIAELTKTKIHGIESAEEVKRIELEIFDQVCDRVKTEIGSSTKKDEFFESYFHGLKEKTLVEEKA